MKDHEIADIVNDLRDIAIQFGQTDQLRQRIAQVIVPIIKEWPTMVGSPSEIELTPFGYAILNDPWRDKWSFFKDGTLIQATRMQSIYPDVRMIYAGPIIGKKG